MSTFVIGIDPGIVCTGLVYAYFSTAGRQIYGAMSLRGASARTIAEEAVHRSWKESEPSLTVISLENFVWQGPRTANKNGLRVSQFVGEIKGALESLGSWRELFMVTKSESNRAIGIRSGAAPKSRIKRAVEAMFPNASLSNEHERDAVAVAVAGWQRWSVGGSRRSA